MTHELPASHVRLKRVYEPAAPEDGVRVLVDRLWPRGLRKAALGVVAISAFFVACSTRLPMDMVQGQGWSYYWWGLWCTVRCSRSGRCN